MPTRSPRSATVPTYRTELALARSRGGSAIVAGIDEVGRGALAGPVVVGACAAAIREGRVRTMLPADVRDSKALTARRREALAEPITAACHGHGLGWAEAAEIDAVGISHALGLAALRAIQALGSPVDAVILDGNTDVLTPVARREGAQVLPPVALQIGADRLCRTVAAASVLAKVARDAHMVRLAGEAPQYGWGANKGYGARAHREAIREHGTTAHHRCSWNLLPPLQPPAPADVLWSDDGPDMARDSIALQEGIE